MAFRGRVPAGRTLAVRQRPHSRRGDRSRFTGDGWSSRRFDGGRWIVEMLRLRERRVSWRSSTVVYGPASRAPPSGPVACDPMARVAALARPVDHPRAHRRWLVRPWATVKLRATERRRSPAGTRATSAARSSPPMWSLGGVSEYGFAVRRDGARPVDRGTAAPPAQLVARAPRQFRRPRSAGGDSHTITETCIPRRARPLYGCRMPMDWTFGVTARP